MKADQIAFLLCGLALELVAQPEQFRLTDPATGAGYGPFEYRDGAVVQIGSKRFVLTKPSAPSALPAARKDEARPLQKKMESIVFPSIVFREASIQEVVEFLRNASREYDKTGGTGKGAGVNLVLNLGAADAAAVPKITYSVRQVSLSDALKLTVQVAGLKYRVQRDAVMIVPADYAGEMFPRAYSLTPTACAVFDRQSEHGKDNEKLKKYLTGVYGIALPPGSSVSYEPELKRLVARSDAEGLEALEGVLQNFGEAPSKLPPAGGK